LQKLNRSSREGPLQCSAESLVKKRNHSQQVQNHGIVIALSPVPPHKRDTDATGEALVHLGLILKLRVLGLDGLELDGNFFARDDIDTEVDVT
jgi:hypothetical protein